MSSITGKVVLLGNSGVGKTSVFTRCIQDVFQPRASATVGSICYFKSFLIESSTVKLEIWDTAGMERFRGITYMYYRHADAAIIFFDITSRDSFQEVKFWVNELRNNNVNFIAANNNLLSIVGNKVDLTSQREVLRDEAYQYAKEEGAVYYECSAMSGQGVQELFEDVAQNIFNKFDPDILSETVIINSQENFRKKMKCCNK
ncbi:putative ras-related protein Rab-5B [Tribolium madens]|uniref:putative ras-related protein Rab-5B n=1 Tax=Tribolium madens TaxID=41895 RepID=UPI001CF7365A|nr:putative ras-related protein Rab-5B [Tribolium madens]